MSTINDADRSFQRSMVRSMAKALAGGLLEADDEKVQEWAARCETLVEVVRKEYGDAVAMALLDQARAESETIALRAS